jgi:putative addiction module killer protein
LYRLRQTESFGKWLGGLRDAKASAHPGAAGISPPGQHRDTRSLGGGLREMRVHVGPGYRVYFAQRHGTILLLLCGGAKSSQAHDIERAKRMLAELDKG